MSERAFISVESLSREFSVAKRPPGLKAALASLWRRERTLVSAVDALSFQIEEGERVGLLGPNGAGKTTTLKMLCGLLHPSGGRLSVAGYSPFLRQTSFLRSITLVMGQKSQLYWDLPPSDTFELNRALYGVGAAQYEQTLKELLALFDVGDLIDRPTRQLSLGERMKCELIAALIHRPQILFLDEPTLGLDVASQMAMRRFIAEYCERHGATLILTSHDMDDVAALCPRVLLIDSGRLAHDGRLPALRAKLRPRKRLVAHLGRRPNEGELAELVEGLDVVQEKGEELSLNDLELRLQVGPEEAPILVSRLLGRFSVVDFTLSPAPLSEVMQAAFERGGEGSERDESASGEP